MELLLVEESKYLECIKAGILAKLGYLHGAAPITQWNTPAESSLGLSWQRFAAARKSN